MNQRDEETEKPLCLDAKLWLKIGSNFPLVWKKIGATGKSMNY
jgi:hypothetical protein